MVEVEVQIHFQEGVIIVINLGIQNLSVLNDKALLQVDLKEGINWCMRMIVKV